MKIIYFKITVLVVLLFCFIIFFSCSSPEPSKIEFGLVMHGGAGNITKENTSAEKAAAYEKAIADVLEIGYNLLDNGNSALDVVEAIIVVLEDSPLFNAGKGAVFNNKGEFELDASIMEGRTLNAGAVAGVKNVKNPIKAARLVMDSSSHVLLSGIGADLFSKEYNLEMVSNKYFLIQKRRQKWENLKNEQDKKKLEAQEVEKEGKFGTVGVAVLDKNGNLAAGTSTGGMSMKKYGRVGDSPIIGAGTYAKNNTCAVSCTGHGEYFIRYAAAHDISALMEYKNISLQQAARQVIHVTLKNAGGKGGVVGIDTLGNVAMEFNTPGMFRGYYVQGEKPVVKMFADKHAVAGTEER